MYHDEQGRCHSYYGTWNINEKPKLGVDYFMLDEHTKKTVEKEKEILHKEFSDMMKSFNRSLECSMYKNEEEIKTIRSLLSDLTQFIYKMIDINKLNIPEIDKVRKKKKNCCKVNKEDSYDGYL